MEQYRHIFTYTGIYEFLTGPVFVVAVVCSAAGFVFQIRRFFKATVRLDRPELRVPRNRRDIRGILKNPGPFLQDMRYTLWAHMPVIAISTTVFHILVIVTPVFLLSHNVYMKVLSG